MFLFRLLKKNKKSKNSSDVSGLDIAEDTLEAFSNENDESKKHVAIDPWIPRRTKLTTEVLVKGAADSKPKIKTVSQQKQSNPSFVVVNNTFLHSNHKKNLSTVTSQAAGTSTNTRLYPDLSSVADAYINRVAIKVEELQSTNAQTKTIEVKELTSIHDVVQEIVCRIEPRIVHVNTITDTLSVLKNDVRKILKKVSSVQSPLQLEYTFDSELNFMKNYPYTESYEQLHTHKKVTNPFENKLLNDKKEVPIFLNYHQSFKSYKGQKGDIIVCD